MLYLSACAASMPKEIQANVDESMTVHAALAQAENVAGKRIRWGGRIAKVENAADGSWVEVVEQPLYSSGRPRFSGPGILQPYLWRAIPR